MNKYISNTFWMLFEQLLRIVSGLLVSIFIANFYGPEIFGEYSFVLAIVTMVLASTKFGMDAIVVKELSSDNEQSIEIFATSFWLMLSLAALIYFFTLFYFFITGAFERINILIVIILLSSLFSPFLAIDFLFQSKLKSKITCLSRVAVMVVMTLVKLYFIIKGCNIYYLVSFFVLDHAFLAIILIVNKNIREPLYLYRRFDLDVLKRIFKRAFPIALASLATIAMMRVDQLMIGHFLGMQKVGIYSAAVKLYEAWILIPYVVSLSLLPYISKIRKRSQDDYFYKRLSLIFSAFMYCSFLAFVFVYFLGDFFIELIFGEEYSEASQVLKILILSVVFSSVANVTTRYMIVSELENRMLLRSLVAVLSNVILNIIFIPKHGIQGSAYATLISMFISAYLLDLFDFKMKKILASKMRAFNILNIVEFLNAKRFK